MNANGAAIYRSAIGQAQDQYLAQMIEIQKRINALADSVPAGTIPKERLDSVTQRLDQCRASAGTLQGVQCALQAEAEFKALVQSYAPSAPVWPWIAGAAVVAGVAALLLSSGDRRR